MTGTSTEYENLTQGASAEIKAYILIVPGMNIEVVTVDFVIFPLLFKAL